MLIFINNIFIKIISILDLNNANNSNFNDDNNCDNINIIASLQNTNIINFQFPSSNIKEYIAPYSDYQLDGLKEFLRCIKNFLDRKKDFKNKMQILKIVINQVERSRYTDMTAIIPIIIDFMNNNQEIYRSKSTHFNCNDFNSKFILKVQKIFFDDNINSNVINFLRNYLSNYSIDESMFILIENDNNSNMKTKKILSGKNNDKINNDENSNSSDEEDTAYVRKPRMINNVDKVGDGMSESEKVKDSAENYDK